LDSTAAGARQAIYLAAKFSRACEFDRLAGIPPGAWSFFRRVIGGDLLTASAGGTADDRRVILFLPKTVHQKAEPGRYAGTERGERLWRRNMPHSTMLHRCALHCAIGVVAAICSQTAYAQPLSDVLDPPDDAPLDQPLDLTTPLPEPSSSFGKADLSGKFARQPGAAWDAKVGVDHGALASPALRPEQWLAGVPVNPSSGVQSSGIAWANVTAPGMDVSDLDVPGLNLPLGWDKASIETRVDPLQELGKLGTTFSRSVPLGSQFSMTWQNGYSVTQTLGNSNVTGPSFMIGASSAPTSQVFGNNQAVRFNILPTDTTFAVGAGKSTVEERWERSLSAEQKLFGGPISITGSVSESSAGDISKSLKAGFKRTW
jgi:hypothetical protein